MKRDITVVENINEHDWEAEFQKPDLLVMAIDNNTVFKINKMY